MQRPMFLSNLDGYMSTLGAIRPHGRQLVTKATGEKKRVQSKLL